MFDVGAPELLVLAVLAVILFGPEKLPEFARKAARVINYVRTMAGSAQQQLKDELGPEFSDVDVRDLNPKTFIQKHLLDDVEPLVDDVKKELAEGTAAGRTAASDVTAAVDDAKSASRSNGSAAGTVGAAAAVGAAAVGVAATNGVASPRVLTPFDPDAT
ncbi:Sec-independent protein translocase protein TatB [Microlunatus phosphovorus NM-1]|uniref:Sec-independent protein translocase protein TatB n=1 Tax=Microlunatus phosphovorus (strain ATCC 700054 / DSM 10555 / JCM 9379 / NBRC 101784 / NCIMB 13414 / VKM Ac-1990 / NM-1) TaxID=1032480 RepID=F5XSP9_MICPN|nr:sec-independent translocase [Microlunatus phosphovorus]BAK37307.1 Sec-independent protein translocase protein TatB [Microlunatus phosphovorus NM-1]